jgi:hypothetical protein
VAIRKRNVPILFMVNEHERELICEKMAQYGTRILGAYLRKMAINGYVVRLDLSDISEFISLLRRSSNNLNQYAKRAHETGSIYEADVEDVRKNFEQLWEKAGQILTRLSSID